MDTIFALATAPGKAGVAIVRVSGPAAPDCAVALTGDLVPPRTPVVRTLRDTEGSTIDEALVLSFPSGRSFTGEDVVEFQTHGSVAVVEAVLSALRAVPGTRLADPGEFTRRALENERLDLVQVEGLADLIDAETEAQRKQAMAVFSGTLRGLVDDWRGGLLSALALIEATIDFSDEELPDGILADAVDRLTSIASEMHGEIAGGKISERIREGFEVAIIGAPNAGKSTLLNALAGRDAAITSSVAGTTRDVIEVRMDLGGIPVTLLDTAGLRETADEVEAIGVLRALERAANADVRVLVQTGDTRDPDVELTADDLVIHGKCDLSRGDGINVSGATREGLDTLTEALRTRLADRVAKAGTTTRLRQRMAIESAFDYVNRAIAELQSDVVREEQAAEELHQALRALDVLTGRVDVERILDVVFASFCLGK